MNGEGRRFYEAGFTVPKPLLPVKETTMIEHVLSHYPKFEPKLFLVRTDNYKELALILKEKGLTLGVTAQTAGPLQTISFSKIAKYLAKQDVLVADCDSFLNLEELEGMISKLALSSARCGTGLRKSDSKDYSYAKLNIDQEGNHFIVQTREKDPFTRDSTTGPYWFRDGQQFLKYTDQAVKDGVFSVSELFNYYLRDGYRVLGVPVKTFTHIGTPEELNAYNRRPNV